MQILKKALKNIHYQNRISYFDIIDLIDKEGIALYQDKYGFIKILTGYNLKTMKFRYVQAPLSYSTSKIETYLYVNKLGFLSEHQQAFDEFEYFSFEIKPITRFWKWFLLNIKGLKFLFK